MNSINLFSHNKPRLLSSIAQALNSLEEFEPSGGKLSIVWVGANNFITAITQAHFVISAWDLILFPIRNVNGFSVNQWYQTLLIRICPEPWFGSLTKSCIVNGKTTLSLMSFCWVSIFFFFGKTVTSWCTCSSSIEPSFSSSSNWKFLFLT